MHYLIDEYLDLNDSVLLFSDNNYLEGQDDLEIISKNKFDNLRCLDIEDFLNNKKKTFYLNYQNIIIEEDYLKYIEKIKYLFDNTNLNLLLILKPDFYIESNSFIISLLENNVYNIDIIEENKFKLIKVRTNVK